eukprot:6960243-Lingulodinium_polyedra.AAC.1
MTGACAQEQARTGPALEKMGPPRQGAMGPRRPRWWPRSSSVGVDLVFVFRDCRGEALDLRR